MKFVYTTIGFIILLAHLIYGVLRDGYNWFWVFFLIGIYFLLCRLFMYHIKYNFYLKAINQIPNNLFNIMKNKKQFALTININSQIELEQIIQIIKKEKIALNLFIESKNLDWISDTYKEVLKNKDCSVGILDEQEYSFLSSKSTIINSIEVQKAKFESIIPDLFNNNYKPKKGKTVPNMGKVLIELGLKCIGWIYESNDKSFETKLPLMQKNTIACFTTFDKELMRKTIEQIHFRQFILCKL